MSRRYGDACDAQLLKHFVLLLCRLLLLLHVHLIELNEI